MRQCLRVIVVACVAVLCGGNRAASQTPTKLDTLKVTGERTTRVLIGREAFDERRQRGLGRFYDSTALRQRAVAHVSDLLQGEQGLAVIRPPLCTAPGPPNDPNVHHNNCVTSTATRVAVTRGLCAMKILLNGNTLSVGGEIDTRDERFDPRHNWLTAFDLNTLDLGGMEKIEVYRRPDEIPMEFTGFDTECGLLVLWTKH